MIVAILSLFVGSRASDTGRGGRRGEVKLLRLSTQPPSQVGRRGPRIAQGSLRDLSGGMIAERVTRVE